MKKISSLMLVLLLCLSLYACKAKTTESAPAQTDPVNEAKSISASIETKNGSEVKKENETEAAYPTNVIEEVKEPYPINIQKGDVLVDDDTCLITFEGFAYDRIEDDPDYDQLLIRISIENRSSKNICVQCPSFSLNDHLIEPLCSVSVKAGETKKDAICVFQKDLQNIDVEELMDIASIEWKFNVFDDDEWDDIGFYSVSLYAQ